MTSTAESRLRKKSSPRSPTWAAARIRESNSGLASRAHWLGKAGRVRDLRRYILRSLALPARHFPRENHGLHGKTDSAKRQFGQLPHIPTIRLFSLKFDRYCAATFQGSTKSREIRKGVLCVGQRRVASWSACWRCLPPSRHRQEQRRDSGRRSRQEQRALPRRRITPSSGSNP